MMLGKGEQSEQEKEQVVPVSKDIKGSKPPQSPAPLPSIKKGKTEVATGAHDKKVPEKAPERQK